MVFVFRNIFIYIAIQFLLSSCDDFEFNISLGNSHQLDDGISYISFSYRFLTNEGKFETTEGLDSGMNDNSSNSIGRFFYDENQKMVKIKTFSFSRYHKKKEYKKLLKELDILLKHYECDNYEIKQNILRKDTIHSKKYKYVSVIYGLCNDEYAINKQKEILKYSDRPY
jgi:hypothetical protein